jgi:TRAP-type C4-dicarboxylate transport system permease large subunit
MTGRLIGSVAWAAAPFFVLMVIGVVIITFFPQIALWLPTILLGGPP